MSGMTICNKNKNCVNDKGRFNYCVDWEADENGFVTPMDLPEIDGYVVLVEVLPGNPAPQNGFDITIKGPSGIDIMGGGLLDLPNDDGKQASPNVSGKKGDRVVSGQLTFELTNNTVAGARGRCIIFVQE